MRLAAGSARPSNDVRQRISVARAPGFRRRVMARLHAEARALAGLFRER
jgi:hypothetical protein